MSEFDDNRPQNENGDPSPQEEPRPAPEHSGVDAGAAPPPGPDVGRRGPAPPRAFKPRPPGIKI